MLSYGYILALKRLLNLVKVTANIRRQLLHQSVEELCVANRVTLISEFSDAFLEGQAEGPADAIRWSLYFDNACSWIGIRQVKSLGQV